MDRFDWLELSEEDQRRVAARGPAQVTDGPSAYAAGLERRRQARFDQAAELFERSLGFDERNYGAWVGLIDSYLRAGNLDAADEASARAIDLYRRVRVLYAVRGLVLSQIGKGNEAEEHLQIALEEPDHWYTLLAHGEHLLLTRDEDGLEDALDAFERAQRVAGGLWEAHYLSGAALLAGDFPAHAGGHFAEAAHVAPEAVGSWIGLGEAFERLRLYDQAVFYYQQALRIAPKHQLALERQRRCSPGIFGLLRIFRREDLHRRWRNEFEKYVHQPGPSVHDF